MLNDVLYVSGTLSNAIYIFDMSNPIYNDNKETFGRSIRTLGWYLSGEYLSQEYLSYFRDNDILS